MLRDAFWHISNTARSKPMAVSVPLWVVKHITSMDERKDEYSMPKGVKEEFLGLMDGVRIYANRDINHVAGIAVDCTFDIMFGHKTTVLNWKMSQFPTMKFI